MKKHIALGLAALLAVQTGFAQSSLRNPYAPPVLLHPSGGKVGQAVPDIKSATPALPPPAPSIDAEQWANRLMLVALMGKTALVRETTDGQTRLHTLSHGKAWFYGKHEFSVSLQEGPSPEVRLNLEKTTVMVLRPDATPRAAQQSQTFAPASTQGATNGPK